MTNCRIVGLASLAPQEAEKAAHHRFLKSIWGWDLLVAFDKAEKKGVALHRTAHGQSQPYPHVWLNRGQRSRRGSRAIPQPYPEERSAETSRKMSQELLSRRALVG